MSKMVSKFALVSGFVLAMVFTFGCASNPPLPPRDILVEKGTYTDFRDGKTYKTVKIGEQTWMAENLNYNTSGSKCYDNNPDNCAKYGRLYDRNSALKACPDGWHLPSKEEWQTLMDLAGGEKFAAKRLKAIYGWSEFKGKSGNGTDNYSFSALPGGYSNSDGSFQLVAIYGSWWSVSESINSSLVYNFSIFSRDLILLGNQEKSNLYSVRCVSHEEALRKLVGTWEGSYYATQGETGLTLDVYEETGSYEAIFRFYNLAGRTNAKEGAYRMSISYYTQADMNAKERYSLKFREWIEQPSGYVSLDINGTLNDDVFSGKTNFGEDFSVTRKSGLSNTSADKVSDEQKKKSAESTQEQPEVMKKPQQIFAQQKDSFTDPRDKKTYKTVKIGDQTWMAENLNYEAGGKCYGEGGKVRGACLRYEQTQFGNYCKEYATVTLSNKEIQVNCAKYGRLYNSVVAEKICPEGWHIPTSDEWDALVAFAGGEKVAGKKLKATSDWNENGNGTNDYGFSALPGGFSDPIDENGNFSEAGLFSGVGGAGFWWGFSTIDEGRPVTVFMGNYEGVGFEDEHLVLGSSVRCVQGEAQSSATNEEADKRYAEAIQKAQKEYEEALQKPQREYEEAQKRYAEAMQKPEYAEAIQKAQQEYAEAQIRYTEATQKPQREYEEAQKRHAEAMQKPQQEYTEAQKRHTEATQKARQEYAEAVQKAQQEPQKTQQEEATQKARQKLAETIQKLQQESQEAYKRYVEAIQKPEYAETQKRYTEAMQKPQQEYTEAIQKPQQELQEAYKRYAEVIQKPQQELQEAQNRYSEITQKYYWEYMEALQKAQQEYEEATQEQ